MTSNAPAASKADTDSDCDSDWDSDVLPASLFADPPDFLPPAKPSSTARHTLTTGARETLTLRLVGHNPLWGHLLWHSGRVVSRYLEQRAARLVRGRRVLELGAGAGLPSLVCALRGAAEVVVTDYPDPELISNIAHNISLLPAAPPPPLSAFGYLWGRRPEGFAPPFDTLVLSDLLFNHSEHARLVDSVEMLMRRAPEAAALVFFTPHRPWLYGEDMKFFDLASRRGFVVRKVVEEVAEVPMFEEDPGDRELRRTVFGFEMVWAEEGVSEGTEGRS